MEGLNLMTLLVHNCISMITTLCLMQWSQLLQHLSAFHATMYAYLHIHSMSWNKHNILCHNCELDSHMIVCQHTPEFSNLWIPPDSAEMAGIQ